MSKKNNKIFCLKDKLKKVINEDDEKNLDN